MDRDSNLLFGVLALQADLIDRGQFAEACTLWAARKNTPLADVLLECGFILPADREHIDYLLERRLRKECGDARKSLAAAPDGVKRLLATLADTDVHQSLASLSPGPASPTLDHVPADPQRYSLVRLHADGGIGRVWMARDRTLAREVALKELRPEKAGSPGLCARFLNEARVTSQLEHPGIVPVYELGRWAADDQPYYTMRFVRGRTLTEAVREHHRRRTAGGREPVGLLTLLNAFVTVCQTIAYAHDRGVLHRDLKGQNVVLGDFGEVIVLDWGVAKVMGAGEAGPAAGDGAAADGPGEGLTVQGQAMGTPAYMAPEQACGWLDRIDPRTDVYGLGAILYEVLTGRPPFSGPDVPEVLRRVREDPPAPPARVCPDVPPRLEAICLRALSKDPADRHPGAADLAREVGHWLAELAERKQADEQRARFFALSLDLLAIAGFDGYFKQLNPAWEQALGWTIEELLARPWLEFVHPDDVAPTLAAAEKIMAGNPLLSHENRYRCRDGSYKWLLWNAREIVGERLIYAVTREITAWKRAEERLRHAEAELARLRPPAGPPVAEPSPPEGAQPAVTSSR